MNQNQNALHGSLLIHFTHSPYIAGQGQIIQKYYDTACDKKACRFTITFGNPGAKGVKYCDAYSDPHAKCIPDDNQYKGTKKDTRPPKSKRDEIFTRRGGLYMTEAGVTISSDEDLQPGEVVNRVEIREAAPKLKTRQQEDSEAEDTIDESDPTALETSELEAGDEQALNDDDIQFIEDKISHKIE